MKNEFTYRDYTIVITPKWKAQDDYSLGYFFFSQVFHHKTFDGAVLFGRMSDTIEEGIALCKEFIDEAHRRNDEEALAYKFISDYIEKYE